MTKNAEEKTAQAELVVDCYACADTGWVILARDVSGNRRWLHHADVDLDNSTAVAAEAEALDDGRCRFRLYRTDRAPAEQVHEGVAPAEPWGLPRDVDQATLTFPARVVGDYLPREDEIPERYRRMTGETGWHKLVHAWFHGGLARPKIHLVPGVDGEKAVRHLSTCMASFEPKHEHKVAGVAYLMSLWFVRVETRGKVYTLEGVEAASAAAEEGEDA